jgi:hypothetical protein
MDKSSNNPVLLEELEFLDAVVTWMLRFVESNIINEQLENKVGTSLGKRFLWQ